MDTSETYIKMCQKTEEIQSLWKPTAGDWYLHDYRGTTKTSREFEKQIWGDTDKTWQAIEILCYKPSESKDVVVSSDGEESRCVAIADLVREHSVWLPRQDQLQEMIGEIEYWEIRSYPKLGRMDTSKPFELVIPGRNYDLTAATMEQLWLAFVMSERYNKVWAGTDWIKKEVIYA